MEPRPVLSPTITAAVQPISSAAIASDLDFVVRPRHHRESPRGLAAVADYLARELAGAGYSVTRDPVRHDGATADNIIADRPGEDGEGAGVVLVGAHYDAVPGSPGADDNGSGVAGMLAVARAVARVKTRAAVRFIGFSFEESGLVGSAHYARKLSTAEINRLAAVLVLEMIGYRSTGPRSQDFPEGIGMFAEEPLPERGDFIGVLGLSTAPAPLVALKEARPYTPELPAAFLSIPAAAAVLMPDLLRSDHSPFWLFGAPAVMITDTANFRNPNYHQRSDRLSTLDLDFMTSVARWVTAATLILAGPV
jgi:aminopeptidase YwaD